MNLRLIQRDGFERPILVAQPEGLDLRVPPKSFTVRDVRNCVGPTRVIDVMDVKTQKNIEMSMKDWCKYYESKTKDRLLNVISLEFSHTKLDELVESPMIVKLLDWVDLVWPKFLKESQTESTNTIDKMKYPKVQKYCLMSVKGSYTDFHLDFGGTSVWYHILKGKKIFWMVPPTELNLQVFEEWTLSGMQQNVFFGDTVEECFRVQLVAGNTFFIPSGWIHAVYTLEDSLVFGGNFLHSFGIENQLKVSRIEDATKVPAKFRYPFYTEILWYAVQHYVYCLTRKDHLHRPETTAAANTVATTAATVRDKSAIESKQKTNKNSSSIEIEEELTESDHEESDNNKRKRASSKQASKKSKPAPKKSKRPPSIDDESTDIDSANEELINKPPEKPAANTCRMTKNSLLRLQYEVDEISQHGTSAKPPKRQPDSKASIIKETPSKSQPNSDASSTSAQSQPTATATLNLAEIMLSHESKINGWAGKGNQATWSNPNSESKETKKIHITRYELSGLKVLVKHLSKLSGAKKNLPNLIRNSRALLDDCRKLIVEHESDDPELAVTGKPITPELLNHKVTDINDLIGQFFKSSGSTTCMDGSKGSQQGSSALKIEASHSRLKSNLTDVVAKVNEEKRHLSSSSSVSTSTDNLPSKSTHRETKCLSPNKKFSNAASASPPPRPKSPPTRPLSNNQYTSKTKSNTNLLLPGSFADLIAATSTEKKVFEVSGSANSSLFGLKDLVSSTKSTQSSSPHSLAKIGTERASSSPSSKSKQKVTSTDKPRQESNSPIATSSTATCSRELPKPNSPEPPKISPQKRFISPTIKTVNKEKLIYASAPYMDPLHTSEQARFTNAYPWQPFPQSSAQPISSHAILRPGQASTTVAPISSTQASYTIAPEHNRLVPAHNRGPPLPQPLGDPEKLANAQPRTSNGLNTCATELSALTNEEGQMQTVVNSNRSVQQPSMTEDCTSTSVNAKIPNSDSVSHEPGLSKCLQPEKVDADQKTVKPHKPRGPPKKSKEAREAINSIQPQNEPPPIKPVSNPYPKVEPAINSAPETQTVVPKAKTPKRPKKQKNDNPPVATKNPSPTTTPCNLSKSRVEPSVICGLVAPPSSVTGPKINPQSYLISRPLLFNTMPNLSAAQFQQMSRAPIPLIATSLGSTLSMPLQQGARLVWATQPRGIVPPIASPASSVLVPPHRAPLTSTGPTLASANTNSATVSCQSVPASTHIDNAALLSLATTALSTAPMISSPALSHLNNRVPTPQAIMVSSASNQPTLFTGQQFFRPLMQRMPSVAHYVTQQGTATGPRSSSQLVFARLPNQSQQRYLITQPGFMQQRFQTPHLMTSQPTSTLAFATYKPPADSTKAIKTKKVKTS